MRGWEAETERLSFMNSSTGFPQAAWRLKVAAYGPF